MEKDYLTFEHINKSFGGNHALNDVSFSIKKGTVHVLAGENGAGKSTVLKILAGIYQRDSGDIYIEGKKVNINSPKQAATCGVAMVFQELTLIRELTVEENLFLTIEPTKKSGLINKKEIRRKITSLMDEYGIKLDPSAIAGRLPIAQQQMAEILKVLLRDSQIIILDEPTSSLATEEVKTLFGIIHKLTEKGKTVIFISHRMDEIFEIGNYVTVFKDGVVIGTKSLKEINTDQLIEMMVGRALAKVFPPKAEKLGDVLFEAKHLTSDKLHEISFELRKGEILGVAGLQGHGQSELLNAISGLHTLKSGELYLNGQKIRVRNAKQALK